MITESQIEDILVQMESDEFEDSFVEDQPDFWNYLNSEGFKGLSEEEKQMMFFIHSTIYHTCSKHLESEEEFDIDQFQEFEDQNWAVREDKANLEETMNEYFQDYTEEDLLAFAEDMLVVDEDSEITELGKEVIFITAKSYIDFITQSSE